MAALLVVLFLKWIGGGGEVVGRGLLPTTVVDGEVRRRMARATYGSGSDDEIVELTQSQRRAMASADGGDGGRCAVFGGCSPSPSFFRQRRDEAR